MGSSGHNNIELLPFSVHVWCGMVTNTSINNAQLHTQEYPTFDLTAGVLVTNRHTSDPELGYLCVDKT